MAKINPSNFSDLSEMFSQRGKLLLVYENYKFKEHNRKLASGETKWRCIKDKCKANFHSLGESKSRVITNLSVNHNHEPELTNVLQRQVLSHCLKRKAESDITEKPSKMIRMELAKNDVSLNNLTISDLQCARRTIYTARRKLLPALPKSLLEVHEALNELQPKTNRNTTSELSPNLSAIQDSPDTNNAEVFIKQEEDTSNAEEFLSEQPDSELYCRLCLCVSQDSNSYINIFPSQGASSAKQEKIQQMLQDIIPDLDLTLTYNPGICSDCEARLIASYDFILLCTQNQDTLLNYKSKYVEGPFVNIQAVVEANNPTKKRKMTASGAISKKQKKSLAKDEDMMSESIIRNVSNLKSETDTTMENIEIKVEDDSHIYDDSNEPFNTIERISEQNVFIQGYNIITEQAKARPSFYETTSSIPANLGEETNQGYNILTEQAIARPSFYETTSSIPVNLGEETDNDVSAEHTQPKIEIIDNIQSDVPIVRGELVNFCNVPINISNRSRIQIVEARTLDSSESKSDDSNKR